MKRTRERSERMYKLAHRTKRNRECEYCYCWRKEVSRRGLEGRDAVAKEKSVSFLLERGSESRDVLLVAVNGERLSSAQG